MADINASEIGVRRGVRRGGVVPGSGQAIGQWGALRYTLCLIRGAWRRHGPVLESVTMAAIDRDGDLVSAFGPLGPVHKDIYLDGDLLRTPILLLALLPYRIPTPAEEGWLTLARLVHVEQQWVALASYRCLLDDCTLHLVDAPLPVERPTRVAHQPSRARLARILKTAF